MPKTQVDFIVAKGAASSPLSFAQRRLWFLDQLAPGNPFYTEFTAFRFELALDESAVRRSLNEIVRRHEILRTRFEVRDGQPVQVVEPALTADVPVIDLRGLEPEARVTEVQRLLTLESQRRFDLTTPPLFQATLLRLENADYVFTLAMHHIITDGWSMQIFARELAALYGAFVAGRPSPLPPLSIQYSDYADWQLRSVSGRRVDELLAFWRRQLADAPELQLNTDRPRPREFSFRGAHRDFLVPGVILERLRELCRVEGVTSYMALLAVFNLMLFRYTGQTDIVIGSPVAARDHEQIENLIGFFVNTVVLRTSLEGSPTFRQLLARTRSTALDAFSHQDLPFDLLVEEMHPTRDLGRNPLFQVIFQVMHSGLNPASAMRVGSELDLKGGIAKFDLRLDFLESSDELSGRFEYSTDLFLPTTIDRMIGHYLMLLSGATFNPDQHIENIPLLTDAERRKILGTWSSSLARCPVELPVHEHFDEQVRRSPASIAVKSLTREITYAELERESRQIAARLLELGVQPNPIVGLCARRSDTLIPSMLGILRAGCAYLPLDPDDPPARLAYQIGLAKVRIVISPKEWFGKFGSAVQHLLDAEEAAYDPAEVRPSVESQMGPEWIAYVLYTSGSTGEPKGVCIPHRGIVRLAKGADYTYLGSGTVCLQAAPLSFDAATFEIWGPLLNGGTVALLPSAFGSSSEEIGSAIQHFGITTLWITAGLLPQLVEQELDQLRTLKCILTGGDVPPMPQIRTLLGNADATLLNGYGPTEATTFTAVHRVTASDLENAVPIGRPVANTKVYVLSREMQPAPVGVDGELYVGGDGLALGYLGDAAATAEKFVPDPFANLPGGRLYRTGDIVRWRSDGNLEFRSRIDNQIKIRGFRVEPADVEAAIRKYPGVRDAAVIARGNGADTKRLVAYVAADETVQGGDVRVFLETLVPAYLLPSSFVILPSLPLSANGKVDRAALPEADLRDLLSDTPFEPAVRQTEGIIAAIWQEVLGLDRVSVHDNFFEVGGHSLLLAQVHSKLQQRIQKRIPIVDLFHYPTIRALADFLGEDIATPALPQAMHNRAEQRRQALAARQKPARADRV